MLRFSPTSVVSRVSRLSRSGSLVSRIASKTGSVNGFVSSNTSFASSNSGFVSPNATRFFGTSTTTSRVTGTTHKNHVTSKTQNHVTQSKRHVSTTKPTEAKEHKTIVSQNELVFPGALRTSFVTQMDFVDPTTSPSLPTYRVVGPDGVQVDTSYTIDLPHDTVLKMYTDMVTVSIMDAIMFDAQRQGRLSFYMVSAGEEGMAVGSAAALKPQDHVYSQYREQGAYMYRGFTLDDFMNQLYGNRLDQGKGRNMPVHYGSRELNMHTISSPLATQLPHAAGTAYAQKLAGVEGVTLCFMGEGAASEGDFHAALNIAATRNCPVIYFCRNNGYAISTSAVEQYKGDGIASRAIGYGIETIRVDGNDIFAVHRAVKEARRIALAEKKPVLIEGMSYRVSHHSTSDDSFAYRSRGEVESWQRKDNPIVRLRKWLELQGLWSEEQEAEFRTQARKDILTAFSKAEKVKKPEIESAFTDCWAEIPAHLKEQQRELGEILDEYPEHFDLSAFEGGRAGLKDK
ncbi:2-oxoisovalerate dehydrogenase subunit alpha [Yarrowia sp. B02]|nr:2-oxoisovalerate dehydrogenase subunit alpha [Yarrowia sp. B02]